MHKIYITFYHGLYENEDLPNFLYLKVFAIDECCLGSPVRSVPESPE